jgi:tripartite-type tricarboxylate transporter receptor subunit TctC
MNRRILFASAAAALASLLPTTARIAWAESYPTRAIHLVVPFPPGGLVDIPARLYGQRLSQNLKQPVVVENRAGATGTIGTEAVVRAQPDGHTLLFTVDLPLTMAPTLLKLHYDPQRNLIPIAAVARSEHVLIVNAATGIRSMADLVAAARAKPGGLTFSSAGNASPGHLCGAMVKQQTGIDLIHVPYTGAPPAINALLAGDVTMFCGAIQVALPHVKAGSVRALGVTGPKPSPLLPEVPPLSDRYPGLVISNWSGVFAPAGTPTSVTGRLEEEFKKISASPEMSQKLLAVGQNPDWISAADLSRIVATDIAKWRDLFAAAGIRAE